MEVKIIDFYADWCGPCKELEPTLETIEEDLDHVTLERVDVDEQKETAQEYDVRSIPTLIFQTRETDDEEFEGNERVIGVKTEDELREVISNLE